MPSSSTVRVVATVEDLALTAAQQFVEIASGAVVDHGRFSVALAGGNTPRRLYESLASDQFRGRLDWSAIHLFFGDERSVSQNHPESNYRMAYESLISRVEISNSNVHAINGEGDPASNAAAYDSELREFFVDASAPKFDLVLLGLGDDGHTASLFPHSDALFVTDRWVVATWVHKLQTFRITLTAPAINGAANVIFLVSGANKARAATAVLNGPHDPESLPAQLIKPEAGTLMWLLDSQAASLLPTN